MATHNSKKIINWALPASQNPEITDDDFKAMVKESENSPKAPLSELDKKIKKWQQERKLV